jgi:hypothetical protein
MIRTTYLILLKMMLKRYQFLRIDLTDVAHNLHLRLGIQYQNGKIENCCTEILCSVCTSMYCSAMQISVIQFYSEIYYSYVKNHWIFEKVFVFGRRNRYQISTGTFADEKGWNLMEKFTCELLCKRSSDAAPPRAQQLQVGKQKTNWRVGLAKPILPSAII